MADSIGIPVGKAPRVGDPALELQLENFNTGEASRHGLIQCEDSARRHATVNTLLMNIALRYSPVDFELVLVDCTGSGAFEPVLALPHVREHFDLAAGPAQLRALKAFEHEHNLKRRQLLSEQKLKSWIENWYVTHDLARPVAAIPLQLYVFDISGAAGRELLKVDEMGYSDARVIAVETILWVVSQGRSLGMSCWVADDASIPWVSLAEDPDSSRPYALQVYLYEHISSWVSCGPDLDKLPSHVVQRCIGEGLEFSERGVLMHGHTDRRDWLEYLPDGVVPAPEVVAAYPLLAQHIAAVAADPDHAALYLSQ